MSHDHPAPQTDTSVWRQIDFGELEQAVNRLVRHALDLPASDLFFTFGEHDVTVSARHLGIPRRLTSITHQDGRRVVEHLKVMAGMDPADQLRPASGRFFLEVEDGAKIDLRVNSCPTLYGEDVALRITRRDTKLLRLDRLGLHAEDLKDLQVLLGRPGGLILVTGPAGSGKTTTLYACLQRLNDGTRKINTIEDPIEHALQGVHQSPVNEAIRLGFPELLQGVLRQAPDVIMIGEIRDPATAETAVRAANSGLLVLATMPAPIAAGAVDSLIALGVLPHFLSTSLLGILTQRLVRTLCTRCRTAYDLSEAPHTFDDVKPWLPPGQGSKLYFAPGCKACDGQGYTGRTGVFEVLSVSKEIRRLIAEGRTADEIHDQAVADGMIDMRCATLLKVADGITSTEEVVRVIPAEYLAPGDY
ncbi:MAG: type II/IV secretion system protein [Pirellulales bacterium]|nr:type II/IV secretion system protein [Pirellulales bacterium]